MSCWKGHNAHGTAMLTNNANANNANANNANANNANANNANK